jgi:biotin carboxyl carrier protein
MPYLEEQTRMRYVATSGERKVTVELADNGGSGHASVDDVAVDVQWQAVGNAVLSGTLGAEAGHYSLLVGARSYDVYVHRVSEAGQETGADDAQVFEVAIAGQTYRVRLEDERTQRLAQLAGGSREKGTAAVVAPMPGLVSNIMATVGEAVQRAQTVVVLEAMKMENDLGAPRAGVVRDILVEKGQAVNQGQVLAIIGDPEGTPAADDSDESDE